MSWTHDGRTQRRTLMAPVAVIAAFAVMYGLGADPALAAFDTLELDAFIDPGPSQ